MLVGSLKAVLEHTAAGTARCASCHSALTIDNLGAVSVAQIPVAELVLTFPYCHECSSERDLVVKETRETVSGHLSGITGHEFSWMVKQHMH